MSTVENNWSRCVSSRECDAELIKGFVKIFKNQIHMLLETIINLVDSNVSFVLSRVVACSLLSLPNFLLLLLLCCRATTLCTMQFPLGTGKL